MYLDITSGDTLVHDWRDTNANTPPATNNMPAVPAMAATVDVTIISSFDEVFVLTWRSVIVDIGEDVILYVEEVMVLELVRSVVKGVILAINITLRSN